MWAVYEVDSIPPGEVDEVTVVRVLPKFGKKHSKVGDECWCHPDSERYENGNFLMVHHEDN